MRTRIKVGIAVASSLAVVAVLVTLALPQETSAREPLHMAKSTGPSAYLGLYEFGPCDRNSNFYGAAGTVDNPAILKRGGIVTIRMCGMNLDPATKTYTFDMSYLGNPQVNVKNITKDFRPPFVPIPGGLSQDGLHAIYEKAITVPGYSQAKDIPDTSHLTTPDDVRSFVATYLRGKKPDVSHFEIHISADSNATLGVHAFWLVEEYPMYPAGSHVNARVIAVKVVP